jgi:hypothetical protein
MGPTGSVTVTARWALNTGPRSSERPPAARAPRRNRSETRASPFGLTATALTSWSGCVGRRGLSALRAVTRRRGRWGTGAPSAAAATRGPRRRQARSSPRRGRR